MTWDRVAVVAGIGLVPAGILMMLTAQSYLPLVVMVALALVVLVLARRTQRGAPSGGWVVGPAVERAERPVGGSTVTALAPVEARELLLSPWFATGIGFCIVLSVAATTFERSWWGSAMLLPLLVHPLCGLTIVAVHRNVARPRRDGAEELFESCPVSTTQRAGASLLTAVVPIVVAGIFVAGLLIGSALTLDMYGPIDVRVVGDALIAGVLLPAGAVALGVLLGRFTPFVLAPFLAIGVIAFVNLEFWDEPDGRGWLATGNPSESLDAVFVQPPVPGRLVWFIGLVVVVAGGALWSGRRSRGAVTVAVGTTIVVTGVVLVAIPPTSAAADRLAGYATGDPAYSECFDLATGIELCAPAPYRDHGAALAEYLEPVAAAVPTAALESDIRLGFNVDDPDALQGGVRHRVENRSAGSFPVGLPFGHHDTHFDTARFDLARAAVGIPTLLVAPEESLVDGQARGVIMLWLATADLTTEQTDDLLTPDDSSSASRRGAVWPSYCGTDVQWAPEDVTAARSATMLDREFVSDVLADDWDRWTDPETTTDDLLLALGLDPVGPPTPIEPLGELC